MKCNCQNGCGKTKGLAHIGVFTQNMEESIRFYSEILGFTLSYTKDLVNPAGTTKLAFVEVGSCIIELIQPSDTQGIAGRTHGIVDHIAIEVEDIEKLVCRLYDEGIKFETEMPMHNTELFGGCKMIFLSGPSGERLELFDYMK